MLCRRCKSVQRSPSREPSLTLRCTLLTRKLNYRRSVLASIRHIAVMATIFMMWQHVRPLLHKLYWLKLPQQIQFWSCSGLLLLHCSAPPYMQQMVLNHAVTSAPHRYYSCHQHDTPLCEPVFLIFWQWSGMQCMHQPCASCATMPAEFLLHWSGELGSTPSAVTKAKLVMMVMKSRTAHCYTIHQ